MARYLVSLKSAYGDPLADFNYEVSDNEDLDVGFADLPMKLVSTDTRVTMYVTIERR